MKNRHFFAICIALAICIPAFNQASAQGVAFNASGAAADASAMVDVSSTSKGMLIPRMTNAQINAISSPATGLMVYQTDGTPGFYYYNGSSWIFQNPNQASGTTNYIPKFTSAGTVVNSAIYQNGTNIGIGTTLPAGALGINNTSTSVASLSIIQAGTPATTYNGYSYTPNYGFLNVSYTGPTDGVRTGLYCSTVKSAADVNGTGIQAWANNIGIQGNGESSSTASSTQVEGVEGDSYGSGAYSVGVAGFGNPYISAPTNNYGVYGWASGGTTNYAVYSDGNLHVNGVLSKSSGTFKIDHPLDPENKYLSHSFVESPDMMNVYNGNVVTDALGNATVALPEYFEALNKDFRYQLTAIGQPSQVYVSKEISGNQFEIKSDKPNVKVSWQVTGVRHDAWANAHRVVAEEDKEPFNKGKYLNAKEFGKDDSRRIGGGLKPKPRTGAELPANKDASK